MSADEPRLDPTVLTSGPNGQASAQGIARHNAAVLAWGRGLKLQIDRSCRWFAGNRMLPAGVVCPPAPPGP